MKKIYIILILIASFASSNAQYFEATLKKNGNNLEFVIRPKVGGTNITNFKFDNIDMFIRWPNSEPTPVLGTPVVNTTDFPGLTISNFGIDQYSVEPGYTNMEFSSPSSSSTNVPTTYMAGVEYIVFTVPITGTITPLLQFAANNEDANTYYLTLTRNTAGIGGASDHSSHNTLLGGNVSNQLFYALPAQLSSSAGPAATTNFYQILSTVLPVKFTNFDVTKKTNDAVINWTVANEDANTNHYEIERSTDGSKYETIQNLLPLNNGNTTNTYTKTDINLTSIKNVGLVVYYRIKQVDNDGKISNSDVKIVRLTIKGNEITAYPNPIKDVTLIQIDLAKADDVTMNLYNAEGKLIQNYDLQAVKGLNTKKIDMANLAAGKYMLKVTTSTEVKTIKLIKL